MINFNMNLHDIRAIRVERPLGRGYAVLELTFETDEGEFEISVFSEKDLALAVPPTPSATEEPPRSTDPVEEVDDDIPF